MRHGLIFARRKIFVLSLLLIMIGAETLYAQLQSGIKNIRTVVYSPVRKDTSWVTGKVVDFILFVKYDNKGRKMVENRLKPDGSPDGKLVYLYNAAGQVAREIYATADEGVSNCWDYKYDEQGRMNSIIFMDGKEDTLRTVFALYGEDGKVQKRYLRDYQTGRLIEIADTASLKRAGAMRMGKMRVVKDDNEKNLIRKTDKRGNWTERFEGCGADGTPKFIVRRDINYAGDENDRMKLPLQGKVKRVIQNSYIAIPKGPQTIDKGEKKGHFFMYEFDEDGRKTREDCFSDKGKLTEKIRYEYDADGNLVKETHYTPAEVLTKTKAYFYDKDGRMKHCSVLNEKGELSRKDILRYDLEGNPVQEVSYRTDGTKCREFRYIFDSYGQQVERKVLLQSGEDTPVYPLRRAYSFQGRIVAEEYLLQSGVGRNLYTYRYNTKGEVISGTEQLDGQSDEVKYVYKFYYDKQGNWKIRIKYVDDVPVVYEEREFAYYQ